MSKEALAILHRLTGVASARQKRLLELLKPAEADFAEGWFMCVPRCLNGALDIRCTERVIADSKVLMWTQGSAFSFTEGDTLYDSPAAYTEDWSQALQQVSLCLQVSKARPVSLAADGSGRYPGSVTFRILKPDRLQNKLIECGYHSMSQDEFVRFLIAGPSGELTCKLNMK